MPRAESVLIGSTASHRQRAGQGPGLHRHPYPETWVVLEGEVRITIGEQELVATAGDTATAPADTWHRFVAIGTSRMRMVCIHASDVIVQEFAE